MDTRSPDMSNEQHAPAVGAVAHESSAAVEQACARIDRRREALRQRLGEVSLTSDLIREVREP